MPRPRKIFSNAPSRTEKNPFMHTLMLNRLSKLKSAGAFAKAIELFRTEALPKPIASDEIATHVMILQITGQCYEAQVNWKSAVDCYQQAIHYSVKIGHNPQQLKARMNDCKQKLMAKTTP